MKTMAIPTSQHSKAESTGLAIFLAKARTNHGLSTEEFSQHSATSARPLVPRSMFLSEALRKNAKDLRDIPLIPLNCTFGVVNEKAPIPFRAVLKHEAKLTAKKRAEVSVVFVVRRPGCVACREHGQQLTELAKEDKSVVFWSIVKETGIEEEGILTFYSDYFHFPLYKDEKWRTYKAMGERALTPFKLFRRCMAARGRWAEKGIPNRVKGGDIWVQGGILLFKKGKLRFAYEEEYGKALEIADIRAAIKALQEEDDSTTYTATESSNSSVFFTSSRAEI